MQEYMQMRLDKALVARGYVRSRARAVQLITEDGVRVNDRLVTEPDFLISEGDAIGLNVPDIPWVSRAALKLISALDHWGIDPNGKVTLDVGASTGGFTQVLLERGAARVYALDVGHGQLDPHIASNERVVVMEGKHVNTVQRADFADPPRLVVVDLSFISLTKVLPHLVEILEPNDDVLLLIKPQFEVGREDIGKGVVKDPLLHDRAIQNVRSCAQHLGFHLSETIPSPILGGDGNKEFLLHLRR